MVLLRFLGKMGQMERGKQARLGRVSSRPDAAVTAPSERARLAEWKRQPPSGRARASVSRRRKSDVLAEARDFVRNRKKIRSEWPERRENDGAIRLRFTQLLATRHQGRRRLRLQHRNEPRPRRSAC